VLFFDKLNNAPKSFFHITLTAFNWLVASTMDVSMACLFRFLILWQNVLIDRSSKACAFVQVCVFYAFPLLRQTLNAFLKSLHLSFILSNKSLLWANVFPRKISISGSMFVTLTRSTWDVIPGWCATRRSITCCDFVWDIILLQNYSNMLMCFGYCT